jgi:hypothetical protein
MSTQEKINVVLSFLDNDDNYHVSKIHEQDLYNLVYGLHLFLENKLCIENSQRESFHLDKEQKLVYLDLINSYLSYPGSNTGDEKSLMARYFRDQLETEKIERDEPVLDIESPFK